MPKKTRKIKLKGKTFNWSDIASYRVQGYSIILDLHDNSEIIIEFNDDNDLKKGLSDLATALVERNKRKTK